MFNVAADNARYISRLDPEEILGTASDHPFQLEDCVWPTVEHYFQAMQFSDEQKQERIRQAESPQAARKLGKTGLFRRPRSGWADLRRVYMTRAVYTKCRTHQEVTQALLGTDEEPLVENDQYDYFWGCGRDRRGDNTYGKILMQVRDRLKHEAGASGSGPDTEDPAQK